MVESDGLLGGLGPSVVAVTVPAGMPSSGGRANREREREQRRERQLQHDAGNEQDRAEDNPRRVRP